MAAALIPAAAMPRRTKILRTNTKNRNNRERKFMERERGGSGRSDGGGGGRFFQRRRPCRFCIEKGSIDFKDVGLLRNFLTERGRIVPRRISGNCLGHQRELTTAVKRARHIALISFAEER